MKKILALLLFVVVFSGQGVASIDTATFEKIQGLRQDIGNIESDIATQLPTLTGAEQSLALEIVRHTEGAKDYLDDFQWLFEMHQSYSSNPSKTLEILRSFCQVKRFKINKWIDLINSYSTIGFNGGIVAELVPLKQALRKQQDLFSQF